MKKILCFLVAISVFCSCSNDNALVNSNDQDEISVRGLEPSSDCGTISCDFEDITTTDYETLCDFNEALIAQFNNCTMINTSEDCVSVKSNLDGFTTTDRGFDADLLGNFNLLDNYLTHPDLFLNEIALGPVCFYPDEFGCFYDPSQYSTFCGEEAGWTITAEALQNWAQMASEIACSLAGTSCGTNYELNLVGISFSIGTISCGSECDWIWCEDTELYYPDMYGCGSTIRFTASYNCCLID